MAGWQDPHGERSVSSDEIMTGLGRRLPARMGEEVIADKATSAPSLLLKIGAISARMWSASYVNAADPHASGTIDLSYRTT